MNIRLLLFLSAWLCTVAVQAGNLVWYNGNPVVYTLQHNTSSVVETAARLFESDMQAVTGQHARRGTNGVVKLYQLDRIADDELRQLEVLHVPYMKIITRPDAFWIGVRGGRIVIVGSNGRGAAYGLLELSRRAGVSPFKEWASMQPLRRRRLTIDDAHEQVEIPSVAYRGLYYPGGDLHKFATMLLRLKGNLMGGMVEKAVADNFGFVVEGRQELPTTSSEQPKKASRKQKKHNTSDGLDWSQPPCIDRTDDGYGYLMPIGELTATEPSGKHDSRSHRRPEANHGLLYHVDGVQPGLMLLELNRAWDGQTRNAWMARSDDPTLSALQVSLFMDKAWNIAAVDRADLYLTNWLQELFGISAAKQLTGLMLHYYQLLAEWPKRPWEVAARKDTPLNANELGNELDRYLNDCHDTWLSLHEAGDDITDQQMTGFSQLIDYPATLLYEMTEMTLQAQEARHIGRKDSFHNDPDALESAARSILAYEKIKAANSRWPAADPTGRLAGLPAPLLPDTLSREEISRYGKVERYEAKMSRDGSIVGNAVSYNKAIAAHPIPMLGHSMQAVALQPGGSLEYRFFARRGDALLRLALTPVVQLDGGIQRLTVTMDGGQPQTVVLNTPAGSDQRAQDVMRGQAVRTVKLHLTEGSHTLTLTAIDPGIIVDQWMIDYDNDRRFYLFPIEAQPLRP